jgi:hypothetical protein
MTLYSTLLIALALVAGWAVQAHRRHRRFGQNALTWLVGMLVLLFAVRG